MFAQLNIVKVWGTLSNNCVEQEYDSEYSHPHHDLRMSVFVPHDLSVCRYWRNIKTFNCNGHSYTNTQRMREREKHTCNTKGNKVTAFDS